VKDRTYLSWKVAALLIAPAIVLLFVKTSWAWLLALVYALVVVLFVRYDLARAVRPSALEVERTMPPKLSMGVPNPVMVRVHNPTGLVARATVRETPPAGFEGERLLPPLEIGPAASVELRLEYVPPGRGLFSFGPMGARCMGPLGLAGRRGECGGSEDVRVYPDITAVHKYALLSRKGALFELGLRPMRFAGQGTEFESLREYRSGDAYRDVDWKATARKADPVVRTFEAERSQTVVLAVDAGRLMTPVADGMAKLDRAVNAALLLAYLAIEADDQVGLLVFGREVETYLPPAKGHTQFLAILEALYAVEGRVEEPDYRRAFGYLARRLSKRSLIVVFSDPSSPTSRASSPASACSTCCSASCRATSRSSSRSVTAALSASRRGRPRPSSTCTKGPSPKGPCTRRHPRCACSPRAARSSSTSIPRISPSAPSTATSRSSRGASSSATRALPRFARPRRRVHTSRTATGEEEVA
jgi:uncharacterized protein (DUF58 family)